VITQPQYLTNSKNSNTDKLVQYFFVSDSTVLCLSKEETKGNLERNHKDKNIGRGYIKLVLKE
jgi:hypothetical protein